MRVFNVPLSRCVGLRDRQKSHASSGEERSHPSAGGLQNQAWGDYSLPSPPDGCPWLSRGERASTDSSLDSRRSRRCAQPGVERVFAVNRGAQPRSVIHTWRRGRSRRDDQASDDQASCARIGGDKVGSLGTYPCWGDRLSECRQFVLVTRLKGENHDLRADGRHPRLVGRVVSPGGANTSDQPVAPDLSHFDPKGSASAASWSRRRQSEGDAGQVPSDPASPSLPEQELPQEHGLEEIEPELREFHD